MDMPIQSQETIKRKAQKAFEDGEHFGDCPYMKGTRAHETWNDEFRRLVKGEEKTFSQPRIVEAPRQWHLENRQSALNRSDVAWLTAYSPDAI